MRLIDADALLDKVQDYGEGQERLMLIDPYWVRKAPTVERPHGEWVEDGAYYKCPFCSNFVLNDYGKPYFCDHCGADMREGEAE